MTSLTAENYVHSIAFKKIGDSTTREKLATEDILVTIWFASASKREVVKTSSRSGGTIVETSFSNKQPTTRRMAFQERKRGNYKGASQLSAGYVSLKNDKGTLKDRVCQVIWK